ASRWAAGRRPPRSITSSTSCRASSSVSDVSPRSAPGGRAAGLAVHLFLFDIDGTLVTARGAGRAAVGKALTGVYGTTEPIDSFDFRGRTDPHIVFSLMRAAGLPDDAIRAGLDACFAAYVRELAAIIGGGSRVQVMPGMPEVLRQLSGREDALVGLLTGNIEAGGPREAAPPRVGAPFPRGPLRPRAP